VLNCEATAPRGTLDLLAGELIAAGCQDVRERGAQVVFEAELAAVYRANLWSRIASRIRLVVGSGAAADSDGLYAAAQSVDWSEHVPKGATIAVDFAERRSAIRHTHYGALRVKDAIVDQLRAARGERPSVDTRRPSVRIHTQVIDATATFAIDLSGESLHRRGYRGAGVAAPLKENLAAAILLRAGWPDIWARGGAFFDPMTGSGTLPIEAGLIAADAAPGLNRERFGFQGWAGHDAALWSEMCAEAVARRDLSRLTPGRITGSDQDPRAVAIAQQAAIQAGLAAAVEFRCRELAQVEAPDSSGLVAVNPPYGERLGEIEELRTLYGRLGTLLRERFTGWSAAILTGNPALGRELGMRARRSHRLMNGPIDCRLLRFEIGADAEPDSRRQAMLDAAAERPGAQMFANRLRKNLAALQRWAERQSVSCYRVYDADMPEYAFAIDLYGNSERHACVQEYAAPREVLPERVRARRAEARSVLPAVLGIPVERIHLRTRRRAHGGGQYQKLDALGVLHEVQESGLKFLVNYTDYLDTGLFLDHRLTRQRIRDLARGARFLNLYAYTGTATVSAAAGGAVATTSVDLSRTYLDWAARNLARNGFDLRAHQLIHEDCRRYLAAAAAAGFELIFLDPPTFSNSKRMQGTLDVQRDHVELLTQTIRLLAPGGTLVFSTNHRRFRLDRAALADYTVEDISRATLPRDFARQPRIHQCYLIRRP
jgi:23S rRNA (guanine2445-N2)-methyltransferase / 23S rRNA (guanine2069-N7)-methyltransferase